MGQLDVGEFRVISCRVGHERFGIYSPGVVVNGVFGMYFASAQINVNVDVLRGKPKFGDYLRALLPPLDSDTSCECYTMLFELECVSLCRI
jgi:hypothetical protein